MAKSADYFVSGVWKDNSERIRASVTYVTIGSNEYLRTVANSTVKDNLDNSISMHPIK